MSSLVVLGANGFLGRAFLSKVNATLKVKAVARKIPSDLDKYQENISWFEADFKRPFALQNVLAEGDVVINLVYSNGDDYSVNMVIASNIIEACHASKVSRLVHCSSAVVVGDSKDDFVNESTLCNPSTDYEMTKLTIEKQVLNSSTKGFEVTILRPTAIIGPGGRNLLSIVYSLMYGNPIANYLKTFVLGEMPMHLVPIQNVVAALFYLAFDLKGVDSNIFIISSDEDIDNNFKRVQEILKEELKPRRINLPQIILPRFLQVLLFKLINRNDINLTRIYESKKLIDFGFSPKANIESAVRQFSNSIKLEALKETFDKRNF